jgi:uncharacterized protein (DUF1501 family)
MFSRRRFIKIGAASVGSLALRNFGALPAMAQSGSGYKALVCVFLYGGNDSNNSIIPIDLPQATYAEYQTLRASLALPTTSLTTARADVSGKHYYFHGGLTEMADLFSSGNLAVAANVGPLLAPVTRGTIANTALLPNHLFSHSDQQVEWQTSDPTEQSTPFGWGGRTANLVKSMNSSSFPTFLSVAGNDLFGTGPNPQLEINPGGSLNLTGFDYTLAQARSKSLNSLLSTSSGLSLVGSANGVMSNAISDANLLTAALKNVTISTVFPNTGLGAQLKEVATIIKANQTGAGLGMQRQIFFCSLGGFDTHTIEMETHNTLYPQLSKAVSAFYTALTTELMQENNVTLFTESDFSRTFQPTTGDGSDHAWGSNHFVLGGAVKGQKIYNKFPTFALGSNDDFDVRGRWIPTAAVDQYGAALVNWFGVSDATQVFPNLNTFGTNPFTFFS